MKKQARQRADHTSRLDIGPAIKPVEKALNGLADGTDEGGKRVAGNQGIAFVLLSGGEQLQGMIFLQRFCPAGIRGVYMAG